MFVTSNIIPHPTMFTMCWNAINRALDLTTLAAKFNSLQRNALVTAPHVQRNTVYVHIVIIRNNFDLIQSIVKSCIVNCWTGHQSAMHTIMSRRSANGRSNFAEDFHLVFQPGTRAQQEFSFSEMLVTIIFLLNLELERKKFPFSSQKLN